MNVVAAHLAPGVGCEAQRLEQLRQIRKTCGKGSTFIMGDLNVREEEMVAMREVGGYSEASYAGKPWDPRRNKFDAELKGRTDVAGQKKCHRRSTMSR